MRGRKPKPRSERKIAGFPNQRRGDSQHSRPGDELIREADAQAALVKPPWLKKIRGAAAIWDELIRTLPVIPAPHQARPFADLCTCLSRLQRCEALIEKEGVQVTGKNGAKLKNPRVQVAKEYRAMVQRWSPEFFLTPSSSDRRRGTDPGVEPIGTTLSGRWNPRGGEKKWP